MLANRLSEDPSTQVLLLEAGGTTLDPMVRVPKGLYFLLGGSTAINGMQYHRGDPWFWDEIERAGNAGWGWADMAKVFRQIEDHEYGATESRGEGGPMRVQVTRRDDELTAMIIAAAAAAGVPHVQDINEPGIDERIGFVPNMIRKGMRETSATAFLRPIRGRRNLTIATKSPVGHILFDGMFEGAKYLLNRQGFISTGAYELAAFHRSSPDAPTADLVTFISPISLDLTAVPKMAVARHPGYMINGQLLHPTTESSVHISAQDPEAPPIIDARFLESDYDRMATPKLVEWARR